MIGYMYIKKVFLYDCFIQFYIHLNKSACYNTCPRYNRHSPYLCLPYTQYQIINLQVSMHGEYYLSLHRHIGDAIIQYLLDDPPMAKYLLAAHALWQYCGLNCHIPTIHSSSTPIRVKQGCIAHRALSWIFNLRPLKFNVEILQIY